MCASLSMRQRVRNTEKNRLADSERRSLADPAGAASPTSVGATHGSPWPAHEAKTQLSYRVKRQRRGNQASIKRKASSGMATLWAAASSLALR